MVRFKVIKGSHLLLGIAVVILIAAITFVLLQSSSTNEDPAGTSYTSTVAMPASALEAKAVSAFASKGTVLSPSSLQIEIVPDATKEPAQLDALRILIYHTHTHEAYAQSDGQSYAAIETWRTLDEEYSVVRVGRALADELRKLGFEVVHDTRDHEQNSLDNAYIRSLETLENYAEQGETFDLCIDLHRDAYVPGLASSIKHNGIDYAQLMFLIGRGDAYQGKDKPDYEANLSFAQRLTSDLNTSIPGICRNVTVKQGRYNQHTAKHSILVEVGHNLNSLDQALSSTIPLANALFSTIRQFY